MLIPSDQVKRAPSSDYGPSASGLFEVDALVIVDVPRARPNHPDIGLSMVRQGILFFCDR
jgi:hypothetical protein